MQGCLQSPTSVRNSHFQGVCCFRKHQWSRPCRWVRAGTLLPSPSALCEGVHVKRSRSQLL